MKKKGISLLTLIITIIVIIILAGVIIFSLTGNNPANKAKEGVFKQDVAVFKDELEMYKLGMLSTNTDSYNASLLEADKTSATYNGNSIEGVDNIAGIIPGMNKKKDYQDIFMVSKGILLYIGNDENERKWAEEVDVKEIDKSPVITMSNPSEKLLKAGIKTKYEITFKALQEISSVNLDGNIKLINEETEEEIALSSEKIKIGEVKEKVEIATLSNKLKINEEELSEDKKTKKIEVQIDTTELENGKYALKLEEGIIVDTTGEKSKEAKTASFEVSTKTYEDIKFKASTTDWTKEDITITITYPEGITKKKYKYIDEEEYRDYTSPITVTKNTTINAMGIDVAQNETKVADITITKIDKEAPENTVVTNLKSDDEGKITATLTYSDSLSGIDLTKSKYYISTQSSVYATDASVWSSAKAITSATESISYEPEESGVYYVHTLSVDNAGNKRTNVSSSVEVANIVVIKSVTAVSEGTTTSVNTANATIDGKTPTYQNPLIPAGFYPVNTADASWTKKEWNNGLVIRDANGNEYVWVPVASASEFKYTNWNKGAFGGTDDLTATELSTIDTSVAKYGGFYIARYEASNNGGKAQSKKGATTWTIVTYNSAKPAAEAVDSDNGYETVTSTLITGKMWDTTVAWMERASINVIDSSTWGNHSNNTATGAGTKQVTGYSETWKAKNIYDLAGNVWEWTTEIYSTSSRVYRGGHCWSVGSGSPVSYRVSNGPAYSSDFLGFRFALYIN